MVMMAAADSAPAKWLHLLPGIILIASLAGCVTGNDNQLTRIQVLAEKGSASAQTELGMTYYNQVPPDYNSAAIWFLKAARQGYPEAQWHLGMLYANGQGVQKSDEQAAYWFQLATEQGWGMGQTNWSLAAAGQRQPVDPRQLRYGLRAAETSDAEVGKSLMVGQGTPQDYHYGFLWLRQAAEHGDMEAQYRLGMLYAKGTGSRRDNVEAHKWYNLAAAQGHVIAARARDKLSRWMTLAEIYEAQRRAALISDRTWTTNSIP